MIQPFALTLSALLLTTGLAQAAGGMQIGNSVIGPQVQYQPALANDHSAVVPGVGGGSPPSGDQPSSQDIPLGNKNLPDDSTDTPDIGTPSGGTASTATIGTTAGIRRGQFALRCDLKANGDIVFANIGNETLAGGARIKWSARGRQGYLALNVDLPAGARATAADVFDTAKTAPCLASVL